MSGRNILAVGLSAVAALTAAFLWLDFRAAKSETRARAEVGSLRPSEDSGERVRLPARLAVALQGAGAEGVLDPARRRLEDLLDRVPGFEEVAPIATTLPEGEDAALLVEVGPVRLTWTPFYATSEFTVRFAFSSDGDLEFRSESDFDFKAETGEPLPLRLRGELKISDTTRGLMSRRAYRRLVGEALAEKVHGQLESSLYPHLARASGTR